MSRRVKMQVAAANIRIQDDKQRDYVALINSIAKLRRGINVRGSTFIAISNFDESTGIGVLSRFTEIDFDGDWFDIDNFDVADDLSVAKVSIPSGLRPNLSQFWFYFDPDLHVLIFETYSNGMTLSYNAVEKFLRAATSFSGPAKQFGKINVDIIQSFENALELVKLEKLKELDFFIRLPNPDDYDEPTSRVVEERMRRVNADLFEERYKAGPGEFLQPDDRIINLAMVAAQNGRLEAKNKINNVTVPHSSKDAPLLESDKLSKEDGEIAPFMTLVGRLIDKVRKVRIGNDAE